jgi:hypothetical protein
MDEHYVAAKFGEQPVTGEEKGKKRQAKKNCVVRTNCVKLRKELFTSRARYSPVHHVMMTTPLYFLEPKSW